jgi:WD40 repeat protein
MLADSKMLLTACDDMHSHLYDVESASLIEAFSGEGCSVNAGQRQSQSALQQPTLASYMALKDLRLGVNCGRNHAGHESWVLSVAVHPSGNAFVTGSSDSKVRLFDLQQRQCTQTVAEHSDQVPARVRSFEVLRT